MALSLTIPVSSCEKFVEAASQPCKGALLSTPDVTPQPASPIIAAAPQPEWDALASSFAALSNSFAFGSLLLAAITLFAGIGWGLWIKGLAERIAKEEAEKYASAKFEEWCRTEAPQMVRRHLDLLTDATLGTGNDATAADEIGEGAG